MVFPSYLLIPLACGLLYVLGMLSLKRASELGVEFDSVGHGWDQGLALGK